jgi:predicted phage tail protein
VAAHVRNTNYFHVIFIELNIRHQDIVNAIVARLKQTHEQEMEDCLANAVTDTVLKVEVARLEVEKEYEAKFNELRENSEMEIKKIRKMNEEEVSKLEAQYKEEVERRELLEKQHGESSEELRARYEQDMEKQLSALREKLNKEHEEKSEKMREVNFNLVFAFVYHISWC